MHPPLLHLQSSLTGPHGGYGTRYVWPIGFKSRRPYMSVEVRVAGGNAWFF